MFYDIIRVNPLSDRRLQIAFEDGSQGEIDLRSHISFSGVFEALRDDEEFRRVRVNRDSGTIEWPNGADLDPVVLYAAVAGKPVDEVLSSTAIR
jgi:hypothetical protein